MLKQRLYYFKTCLITLYCGHNKALMADTIQRCVHIRSGVPTTPGWHMICYCNQAEEIVVKVLFQNSDAIFCDILFEITLFSN